MFKLNIEDRLSSWAQHRSQVNNSTTPFNDVMEFWSTAPYIPYNNKIDPYHRQSWPSPWELIVENKYDDFTKAIMIAWTLKLTNKFAKSRIEIKTYIDKTKSTQYNIVCVDDTWAINYKDNSPEAIENIPDSFFLENLVELESTR